MDVRLATVKRRRWIRWTMVYEATVEQLTTTVNNAVCTATLPVDSDLCNKLDNVENNVHELFKSLQSKINSLSSLVAQSSGPMRKTDGDVSSVRSRELNVVLFGIPESRNRRVWNQQVSDVLNFVAVRAIVINDALRLGAFKSDQTRPVLVSLQNISDRRKLMLPANCRKLKTFDDYLKKVFVVADENVTSYERASTTAVSDGECACIFR